MQFLVPKEPRLLWTDLYPSRPKQELLLPFNEKSVYFVFWARNAIYHGLKALCLSPGDSILVPSFHCATAIEPMLQFGARVVFYNIHQDCSPDFDDIQAKIDKHTRAILAIHYFGFPQPIRKFQELCKDYHLFLIEDCAHVLAGEADGGPLGAFGDISVFSWRKFLPLYDGGHLIINNPKLHLDIPWERTSFLFSLKVAKNVLEKLINDSSGEIGEKRSRVLRFPQSVVQHSPFAGTRHLRAFTINNYSLDFDLSSVNLRMSGLSKYIVRNIDPSPIVEKRRLNYLSLLKAIELLPGLTPFCSSLPESVCPWVFPVFASGRKDFHTALRSKGIPAFTWSGVIHSELPLWEFPEASFLYQNLVFLPTHQGIGDIEMQTMVKVITEVLLHGH